eukprot:gene8429-14411_t
MSLPGKIRKTYAIGSVVLTLFLSGCAVALIGFVLRWNSFTTEDGTVIRFPVEGLENLKVKRTYSLLWSCVLVMPLCFTAAFLLCFNRRFMLVLMILTGLIAFASSLYASLNFREIYYKIHIIFEEDDAFDERCDSKSYNDVNFCVCNIGPARNKTEKVLKFRVDECDELEDVTGKFYLFFVLSLVTSLLSGVLLCLSCMEYCKPIQNMSAVLLQDEISNYESTKDGQQGKPDNHTQTAGFNNPVFIQCDTSGQKKTVFCYPYTAAPTISINGQQGQHTLVSEAPSTNVTLSNFTKKKARGYLYPTFG